MEIFLIATFAILVILFFFLRDKIGIFPQQEERPLPFKRKDFLLNIAERQFFEGLQKIIPDEYMAFPQMVLSNIVQAVSTRKEFWAYQNRINRKTIDFVIFEKQYLKPIIAIEYDGKTHNREDRRERDSFVDTVLNSAGIRSVHIKHEKDIDFEELKNKINELLMLEGSKKPHFKR